MSNHCQRQRVINTTETRVYRIPNDDSDSTARAQGSRSFEIGGADQGQNGRYTSERLESVMENENEDNENNENDGEGEGDNGNEGPLVPFTAPGDVLENHAKSSFHLIGCLNTSTDTICYPPTFCQRVCVTS